MNNIERQSDNPADTLTDGLECLRALHQLIGVIPSGELDALEPDAFASLLRVILEKLEDGVAHSSDVYKELFSLKNPGRKMVKPVNL